MSRLASSTKCPPWARQDRLASMKPSPVRLFTMTSTPVPSVASRTPAPKSVVRLSNTWATPMERRNGRLGALAVAITSAPAARASSMAANPRPPAPAWIKTRSPALRSAASKACAADTKTLGTVASAVAGRLGGAATARDSLVTACGPKVPSPSATTRSPMDRFDTSAPTSTTRPTSSSPNRPSSKSPMPRKMSQKLSPAASTATRISPASSGWTGCGATTTLSSAPPPSASSNQPGASGRSRRGGPLAERTNRATRRVPFR